MKKLPPVLLALTLLAGGILWYSTAGTEEARIRKMAEEQEAALTGLVHLCQTLRGIERWEMLPGGTPCAGYAVEEELFDVPCGEQLADACGAVFAAYPFDGVYAAYDEAGHVKIEFYQTKKDGKQYSRYYLIYMDPVFQAGFHDSFYNAFQDGYAQKNCKIFDNWYYWSKSMTELN